MLTRFDDRAENAADRLFFTAALRSEGLVHSALSAPTLELDMGDKLLEGRINDTHPIRIRSRASNLTCN